MLSVLILFTAVAFAQGKSALDLIDIDCTETNFEFTGHPEAFPQYKGPDLSLGSCQLDEAFSLKSSPAGCNIKRTNTRNAVEYTAVLTSNNGQARWKLCCRFDKATRRAIEVQMQPVNSYASYAITAATAEQPQTSDGEDLFLRLWKTDLKQKHKVKTEEESVAIPSGSTVQFRIGDSNPVAKGSKVRAVDCWVTPTSNAKDFIRYDLIRDSCQQDETFIARNFGNGQIVSFESFLFSIKADSHMYLHCNLVACRASDSKCGKCVPKQNSSKRFRRRIVNVNRVMARISTDVRMM